ncbi:protein TonB [Chryseobacterium defluvii]|uniref:Protein TonB n=1 Tax=Chryseobacterium defluvii TaxID=160396 RepID=A0A840KAC7_9FLAO|nr:energy transducer TonB [Chryseobacterium defluvii]MBB4804774.1 protein TonB [Chryseobacterium defluvii]
MKHLHQNQEFRFNEILFEHRNKEYGAYALRNESDRLLTKALFVGVGLLAAISITPMVISAFRTNDVAPTGPVYVLPPPVDVETPEVKPPAAQPVQQTRPEVKTFDSTVPTPSSDANENDREDVPENAVAGFKNNFKAEPAKTEYVPSTPTIGTGPVISIKPPVIETPKEDNTIKTAVDEEAGYDEGINTFRNKVMSKFDTSGFEGEGVMKTMITFVVEKDGTISGLKADGQDANFNSEALRTIKSIKGKWIPAKIKGQAVRSYFKFPISMKFE